MLNSLHPVQTAITPNVIDKLRNCKNAISLIHMLEKNQMN